MWRWKFNNPSKTISLPLGIKQSFWLHFFSAQTQYITSKGKKTQILNWIRLKVTLPSQRIPKNSTEKPSESQLHYIKLVSHVRLPIPSDWKINLLWGVSGFHWGKIILKKKKRKKEKQKVDIDQHLCTYSTPCSRMQGYFILW